MALRLKSSTITSKMTIAVPLLIVQTLLLLPSKSSSQNDPTFVNCPPDSNFTISSPYKSDLDLLLSNLTASAPKSSALFSNASVGGAYGLAQCRPDASPADCADCLSRTLSAFASRCPLRISAAIRFDSCLLRYSDRRFFSVLASDTPMILVNAFNASDPTVFNRQLKELMSEISSEASSTTSRFGAGATNYSEFEKIFGMVQCTRDLSDSDCELCLDQAVGLFPTFAYGKIGAQVLRMSCTARFETSPFFSLSVIPPPSAPPPTLPLAPSPRAEPPPPPSVPASPTGNGSTSSTGSDSGGNNDTAIVLAVVIPSVAAVLLLFTCCIFLRRRRRAQKSLGREDEAELRESLLFNLSTIRDATNNFASENKLGQGGFGAVYKGVLRDGQEIAVKRLGGASAQGLGELRNEVVLVAKLQHRNLVRLLGFCLEEQEKLLVYEYLPNTSLDKFLFDSVRSEQLDWRRRYKIIEGIGRGLLYLHEDSRLRIIHRDLKASNVLLDGDMNPKISDFGLAKLFAVDETQGNTSRIAGTFGYMAPEYAMQGQFSMKSDVYSYGVLVLEIVTGQKNSGFQGSGYATDLVGYVWLHWNKGTALQLRDRSLGDDFHAAEFLRCIHIALLCVQEDPTERPSMASVVLMLNSCSTTLPSPSKPAFLALGSTTNAPNLY